MSAPPILFEAFVPGTAMGSVTEVVTPAELDAWAALYPWYAARDVVPAGLATALMMRAYLRIVTPRPPGNLHVRQRLSLDADIRPGDAVTVTLTCASKEMRGTRRLVELGVSAALPTGGEAFSGTISLYWAA